MGRGIMSRKNLNLTLMLICKYIPFTLLLLLFSCSSDFLEAIKDKIEADQNGPAALTWAKSYGGLDTDIVSDVKQTTDRGYIVSGSTSSFVAGTWDAWILKLTENGSVAWEKTYGNSDFECFESVQQTSDGGYIVAGSTDSYGGGGGADDFWLLKLNSAGGVVWQKTYRGTGYDYVNSVQQTSEGGYIVVGGTNSYGAGSTDVWVLKIYNDGAVDWQKTYGGTGNDSANSVQQTSDRRYIIAGVTNSFGAGDNDFWLLRLNENGVLIWQKTYGGTGEDEAFSVHQTSDGGYIVSGCFDGLVEHAWLLRLNGDGTIVWQKMYDSAGFDSCRVAKQLPDGGYICAGFTDSESAGSIDTWLMKLNSDGNVVWQKIYGGAGDDGAISMDQAIDGGYIIAAITASYGAGSYDYWLVKTGKEGEPVYSDPGSDVYLGQDTVTTMSETSIIPSDTFVDICAGFGVL